MSSAISSNTYRFSLTMAVRTAEEMCRLMSGTVQLRIACENRHSSPEVMTFTLSR